VRAIVSPFHGLLVAPAKLPNSPAPSAPCSRTHALAHSSAVSHRSGYVSLLKSSSTLTGSDTWARIGKPQHGSTAEESQSPHYSTASFTPVNFTRGKDDTSWAELAGMRWERSEDWGENVGIMKRRLALLRKMISSSSTLKGHWKKELSKSRDRGIVMSAGGQEQLTNAYASLLVLRKVTLSLLPVVLCHYGDEIPEETKNWLSQRINRLEFLDLAEFPFPDYHLPVFDGHPQPRSREDGYMVKLLALRAAPFKEVIYIDVDSFPLDNPEILFRDRHYRKAGSMFWPDLWRGKTAIFDMFEMPEASPWYPNGDLGTWRDEVGQFYDENTGKWDIKQLKNHQVPVQQTEAGQLVINRERHWDVLEYLLFINMHHNITYHIENMLGDKDTFPAAFGLAGKPQDFYQVTIGPLAALVDFERHGMTGENPRYKTLGQVQLHPKGYMMFHHKTIEKLPAKGDAGYRRWPIEIVTAPISDLQGGNMLFGGSEFQSLGKGWLNWGFTSYDVEYFVCGFNCSCNVRQMHLVDKVCTGRTPEMKEVFEHAFPVTGVKLPEGHLAYRASAKLGEALDTLPPDGLPGF
jgi:hypothetical protein